MTDQPIPTPELDRLAAVHEESQAIGQFLDTSGYTLCRWDEDAEEYVATRQTIEQVLADYFEIDLAKVETERRALLDALREAQR